MCCCNIGRSQERNPHLKGKCTCGIASPVRPAGSISTKLGMVAGRRPLGLSIEGSDPVTHTHKHDNNGRGLRNRFIQFNHVVKVALCKEWSSRPALQSTPSITSPD